jgi:hypothetical protein
MFKAVSGGYPKLAGHENMDRWANKLNSASCTKKTMGCNQGFLPASNSGHL